MTASKAALARFNTRRGRYIVVPGTVRPAAGSVEWTVTRPGQYQCVLLDANGTVLVNAEPSMPALAGDTVTLTISR